MITRVHVPCAKSCTLIQRMITKIGLQVGIGIAHDLTFSDFDQRLLSPLAASNASTVWSFQAFWAIFCNNMQFHVFWRPSKNI